MKTILQTIILVLFLTSCSRISNDPGSKGVSVYSIDTVNLFYKNDSMYISGGSGGEDPYPDTAIFIDWRTDKFAFDKDQRLINIYYDEALRSLAVHQLLDRREKSSHYKRYDRKGNLRMELFEKDSSNSWNNFAWHSNGNLKFKDSYKEGKLVVDTSYSFSGKIERVTLYYNGNIFKEIVYHKNGRIALERFSQIKDESHAFYRDEFPKFQIAYDSLSGFPSLYYMRDKILEDSSMAPTKAWYTICYPTPVDSVELKDRKK